MKKLWIIFIGIICLFILSACGGKKEENDILNPYFTGKVVEVYEKSCLVEVTDIGNGNFFVGEKVVVHTDNDNCPNYDLGDSLTISFDGKVALSYPPQIFNVSIVHKTDGD